MPVPFVDAPPGRQVAGVPHERIVQVLNWLRRRLGWLDRRWIPEPSERTRHDDEVRRRLARGGTSAHGPRPEDPFETTRD